MYSKVNSVKVVKILFGMRILMFCLNLIFYLSENIKCCGYIKQIAEFYMEVRMKIPLRDIYYCVLPFSEHISMY